MRPRAIGLIHDGHTFHPGRTEVSLYLRSWNAGHVWSGCLHVDHADPNALAAALAESGADVVVVLNRRHLAGMTGVVSPGRQRVVVLDTMTDGEKAEKRLGSRWN